VKELKGLLRLLVNRPQLFLWNPVKELKVLEFLVELPLLLLKVESGEGIERSIFATIRHQHR